MYVLSKIGTSLNALVLSLSLSYQFKTLNLKPKVCFKSGKNSIGTLCVCLCICVSILRFQNSQSLRVKG
jgi:hypothetical protein